MMILKHYSKAISAQIISILWHLAGFIYYQRPNQAIRHSIWIFIFSKLNDFYKHLTFANIINEVEGIIIIIKINNK